MCSWIKFYPFCFYPILFMLNGQKMGEGEKKMGKIDKNGKKIG
jgi:hypothetical protein